MDVLGDLVAERALGEAGQPVAKLAKVAVLAHVLRAKGGHVAEKVVVNDRGETEKLQKGVLKSGGGEKKLVAFLKGPAEALAHLVAGAVGVAELAGFVNDNEVPGDGPDIALHGAGEIDGRDDDPIGQERGRIAAAVGLAERGGVQDGRGQVEFLLKFEAPLLTDGGGADDEQAAAPLGPELAENQAGLDSLAQADLVGQEDALAEGGIQGEQGGVNLVRVEINGGVEQRRGEAVRIGGGPLKRQFVGEILRVKNCYCVFLHANSWFTSG